MQTSEFEASLVYSEFQDSQGYVEKPCLKTKQNKTKKQFSNGRGQKTGSLCEGWAISQ